MRPEGSRHPFWLSSSHLLFEEMAMDGATVP
jgi:hypothetical protein